MSPAEELRAAAVLLRQRATDATPGPWVHEGAGPGGTFMGCGQVYTMGPDVEGGDIAAPSGDCYPRGGYSPDGDMAYIATLHPGVGLALADLLDSLGTMPSMSSTVDFHYALVVADAILAGGGL